MSFNFGSGPLKCYFMHCLSANGEILCMKTRAVSDPVENHLSCLRDVSA